MNLPSLIATLIGLLVMARILDSGLILGAGSPTLNFPLWTSSLPKVLMLMCLWLISSLMTIGFYRFLRMIGSHLWLTVFLIFLLPNSTPQIEWLRSIIFWDCSLSRTSTLSKRVMFRSTLGPNIFGVAKFLVETQLWFGGLLITKFPLSCRLVPRAFL